MKRQGLLVSIAMIAVPFMLTAQSSSSRFVDIDSSVDGGVERGSVPPPSAAVAPGPFSRIALGGSVSSLGPSLQITSYITPHLNLRTTGNWINYQTSFTTSGFNANAKLNLASARLAADVYPFRNGFRISPGVMVYNGNKMTATSSVAGGASFTLNGDTFYSASANSATGATPLQGTAELGQNMTKPAFTITAGWGNTIPQNGGHWSFPFEAGVAFTGAPSLNANLAGWACYDQAQTECTNVASTSDPIALQIQGDLAAQIAKWKNNLSPLGTYPILSMGVSYSFGSRGFAR
ncbi:MAG TPA: hypothetical protein VMU48_21460 [Terracidiphilus sp.]|nr:hypothetical protein [Terracidiphilus sp.]